MGRYYERTKRAGKHMKNAGVPFMEIVVGISLLFAKLSLGEGLTELKIGGDNQAAEVIDVVMGVWGTGLLLWGILEFVKKYRIIGARERKDGLKAGYLWEVVGAGFVAGTIGVVLGCVVAYVTGRIVGVMSVYRGDYMICVILLAVTGGIITGGYIEEESRRE